MEAAPPLHNCKTRSNGVGLGARGYSLSEELGSRQYWTDSNCGAERSEATPPCSIDNGHDSWLRDDYLPHFIQTMHPS